MSSNLRDDLGVHDPGLRVLLRSLASAPTPDELAGERAALAMFRTSHHSSVRATAGEAVDSGVSRALRRSLRARARQNRVRRVAWLAAATVALAGGFTAAAYTASLPAPVQHIAYRLLGFAGVPDSGQRIEPGNPVGHAERSGPRHGLSRSGSSGHGRAASPTASSTPPRRVSVRFKTVGHAVTAVLTVTWPAAQRGDKVELQSRSASGWKSLGSRRIGRAGPTKFTVPVGTASVTYRIVLLAGNHVRSVSQTTSVPGRSRLGRHHGR